ncbi:MAG: hypothetical protein ACFFG0_48545 [Candidatus Thorarchaeota archaeon]
MPGNTESRDNDQSSQYRNNSSDYDKDPNPALIPDPDSYNPDSISTTKEYSESQDKEIDIVITPDENE